MTARDRARQRAAQGWQSVPQDGTPAAEALWDAAERLAAQRTDERAGDVLRARHDLARMLAYNWPGLGDAAVPGFDHDLAERLTQHTPCLESPQGALFP